MNMEKEKEEYRHKKRPGIPRGAEQKTGDKQLPAGSLAGQGPQNFEWEDLGSNFPSAVDV